MEKGVSAQRRHNTAGELGILQSSCRGTDVRLALAFRGVRCRSEVAFSTQVAESRVHFLVPFFGASTRSEVAFTSTPCNWQRQDSRARFPFTVCGAICIWTKRAKTPPQMRTTVKGARRRRDFFFAELIDIWKEKK